MNNNAVGTTKPL